MKMLKKISIIMIISLMCVIQNNYHIYSVNAIGNPPRVGVLLFDANDPNISNIKQSLEDVQKENPTAVSFSFYDAKDNQAIQNTDIDNLLQNNVDLLLVNLVDTQKSTVQNIIDKVKAKEIPIIFFNIELPIHVHDVYNKGLIIGTNSIQSGIMQGKLVVDLWNKNKETMDKNKDNVLQYIMLQGKTNNDAAINRSIYSISTINDAGIKTQELALKVCNWNRQCAKEAINSLFLKYNGKIEAIIANNDAMAIGAIEGLQAYGYNKGDKSKYIPVIGVDAISEARDLVDKGIMAGTIIQDPKEFANALYSVGLNLIFNRDPVEGTPYVLDKEGIIRIPYYEYIPKKIQS